MSLTAVLLVLGPVAAALSAAPASTNPVLTTSALCYGQTVQVDLAGAPPDAPLWLLYSPLPGPTPTWLGTFELGPTGVRTVVAGAADAAGHFAVGLPLADDAVLFGFPVNLQAVLFDASSPTLLTLSTAVHGALFGADLDVDVDRDGTVEPQSAEDDVAEHLWSSSAGAVFLYNNDDDDDDGTVDAADAFVNGAADELDLARALVRAAPDVPAGWTGIVTVDAAAAPWVRVFQRQTDGTWSLFDATGATGASTLPAAELAAGVELGLEARDYAQAAPGGGTPGLWDGEVLVTLSLRDAAGVERGRDDVRLRVAPFVLNSNLAPVERVLVTHKTYTTPFVNALRPPVAAAGAVLEPIDGIVAEPSYGVWTQDAMEFGTSLLPAPGGPRRLDAVLRSPRSKPLDAWTLEHCLGPDFGYVYKGGYRPSVGWIDWFGNLDCTPPLAGWPLGRIYSGYQGALTLHPDVLAFLDAQGVQGPVLEIDTGWLLIGHVDEEICFVPSTIGAPVRMVIPSTTQAMQILSNLELAGKGALKVFAGTSDESTVSGLLAASALVAFNQGCQQAIDAVRQQMVAGLGLAPEDVIELPALFTKYPGTTQAVGLMPNMVNALVANGHFITSDPFGPVDGGVDRFQEPVRQALEPLGLQVDFVDDWYPYHEWLGEVHCGTNAVRAPAALPWWAVD